MAEPDHEAFFLSPVLQNSVVLSSEPARRTRDKRRNCTYLKNPPLFSVRLLVAPDRSISAHQPFWRWQMPLSASPSHRTGFFSIDHFLCVCKMGVNIKRKGRARSNYENSTLSASLPYSSSNPLQLLSNKWTHRRVSAARQSHQISCCLFPNRTERRIFNKMRRKVSLQNADGDLEK